MTIAFDPWIFYLSAGAVVVLVAWLPLFLEPLPISLPMVAVAVGLLLSMVAGGAGMLDEPTFVEHCTELALIVAVVGAGLRIDRPFTWFGWASTWRLLAIVMPVSILVLALLAHGLLALDWGAAIVIAGALSPTDPVLASQVQTGPPGSGEDGETRFALTSEAGLNDGLAFPFVTLGIALAAGEIDGVGSAYRWLAVDFGWDVIGGALVGVAIGRGLLAVIDRLPRHLRLSRSRSGIVSVGLAFLAYGLADLVGGNGFVAIFLMAVTLRNVRASVDYPRRMTHAAEQVERIVTVTVLGLFGFIVGKGLLTDLAWSDVLFAALALLVVRPLVVLLAFLGSAVPRHERLAFGYFGIRGLGTLYYVAYALGEPGLPDRRIAMIAGLVVLTSVFLHGATADHVLRRIEGR